MFAVVIDPIVCQSSIWWMFPECWGVAICVGAALTAGVAATVRRMTVRAK